MTRSLRLILTLGLLLAAGCTRANRAAPALSSVYQPTVTATQVATALPLLLPPAATTAPAPTRPASATPAPDTPTPTVTLRYTKRPTRTPSNTPTITPTPTLNYGNTLLRINAPGPMSKLISPINFIVQVAPGYTGVTRIELISESGRELYRKTFRTYENQGYYTRVSEEIKFEIPAAAEIARLQISTVDKYGRLAALNSVRLMLLTVGENQFTPPFEAVERAALWSPKRGEEISGGLLQVQGEMQPLNANPVVAELFDIDGKALASRILTFDPAKTGYQAFETSLPYQVEKNMPARLVLRQADDRIPGLAYLYSIEILLKP
jgi:hypothetical protein